jgi:3'-phosphoadenosine 5'-phosphosulfate sulfotransferase (PAPS reductase)/FAD synthetase
VSKVVTSVDEINPNCTDFALFSGGNDSVVSTHVAQREYDIDWVVYLDTNTGIQENIEHVKEVCHKYDWDLAILSSPVTLREFVLGTDTRQAYGFPGPAKHSWAYNYLKERQLSKLATRIDSKPRYYTGVRSHESERRMETVGGEKQEADRWIWMAPIHDWRDERVDDYRAEHNLPNNPVAEKIGKSGDCLCGAFDHRNDVMVELEAHYPERAEWIKQLETEAQEKLDTDEKYTYWGFGGLSEKELRAEIANDDMAQMSLCSSCDVPDYPRDK